MTKIVYAARESRGINYISLTPPPKPIATRLSRVDRILIAIVICTYVGLAILLAK